MKSTKFIVGVLAGAALLFSACQDEISSGEDASRLTPGDLRYDVENSTSDALALCWSAGETIAAGATSYSIEVCDEPTEAVSTYDDNIQTIKASAVSGGVGRAVFTKGVSEYTEKYARMRAHYGASFSPWVFAKGPDGNPAVFVTGHGIKDPSKAAVDKIDIDCPADKDEFTISADLSSVASASRVLVLLMDYTSQSAITTILVDPSKVTTYTHTFEGLHSGKLYQVKMLVEYDNGTQAAYVSDWTMAEDDVVNDEGETIKSNVIQCGKGIVFINGVPPTVKLDSKTSGQLVFQWTEYGFGNIAKDAAIPVKVALYKNAGCTELVYGWTISKYEISGRQPTIVFSNLEPETSYWFTCQDTNTGLLSDALEAKTASYDIVMVGETKVKAGEYALAENFSELYYGGYAVNYSPNPSNAKNGYVYPTEGKWDSASLVWSDGNHGFFNTLGSTGAVEASRFKDWAVVHGPQNGTGSAVVGDCCIRTGMFQMGASSGIPQLFTPELTNLEGLATVTLSFTASSMWEKGAIKEASSADFQSIAIYTATGGTANKTMSTSYGTLTGATIKEVAVLDRPATDLTEPTWETKSVTLRNVAPGTRIGIGAVRPDGKTGNQRWLLSDVKVKVESYGVPTLETPVLKSKEIHDISATFEFEAQDQAQSYKFGYKKSGDKEYSYIENTKPSFELTGLEMGADYIIKVTALAGEYESETPFFLEFTTAVVIPAVPVIDAAATDVKATSVVLAWGAAENATSYIVNYKKSADSEWTEAKAEGTSLEIKGLKDNTAYDFRVASVRGNRQSEFCAPVTLTTPEISWDYPLTINDAETFASWVNTGAEYAAAGNVVTLGNNIDISGMEISIIPTFAGTLNGNGKTLKIATKTALINKLTGVVKDLTVDGSVTWSLGEESATGHALAALALLSSGEITGCTNKAAVSFSSTGVVGAPVVAGLVAYQEGGKFSGNVNYGTISMTHAGTAHVAVDGFNRKPFSVAGGLVGVVVSATVDNCRNEGAVNVKGTDPAKIVARHYIGGLVGTPEDAVIKDCVNKGAVTADFTDAAKSAAKQVWVGGIVGGRNGDVKTVDGALVDNCKNYGTCTLIAENSVNNYLGGIAGQATIESGSGFTLQKITNSTNYGKLVKKGAGGCRMGGISGGAATLDNCSNEGEIVIENISASGAVGGLVGYPTQAYHTITNCKSLGKMTSTATAAFAMGGIGGQAGNTAQTWSGCTVNCAVSGQSANLVGMVVGTAKTMKVTITLGTAEAPIKVKGSVNGTAITADNLSKYISSDGTRSADGKITTAAKGTLNAANVIFGE